MEFVQQLREHRQKASEQWARDQFFSATSDRRTSRVSLATKVARFLRRLVNLKTLIFLLTLEALLRLILQQPPPLWLELIVVLLSIFILIRLSLAAPPKKAAHVEMVDHRRIIGKAGSPEKEV